MGACIVKTHRIYVICNCISILAWFAVKRNKNPLSMFRTMKNIKLYYMGCAPGWHKSSIPKQSPSPIKPGFLRVKTLTAINTSLKFVLLPHFSLILVNIVKCINPIRFTAQQVQIIKSNLLSLPVFYGICYTANKSRVSMIVSITRLRNSSVLIVYFVMTLQVFIIVRSFLL